MEIWYLLYDGSSPDGMGPGYYCGRTTDKEVAKAHFLTIWKDPYSTGKVVIVTDKTTKNAEPIDFNLTRKR